MARPLFHPTLVNDSFGDPGLLIEFMFEKRALLFDLGDLSPLSSRKLLRVSHVFVSHRHMDHFSGFDQLLRICLGREKALHLFGPEGIIGGVEHKLAAYSWNLVHNYTTDFTLIVGELIGADQLRVAEFHCKTGFSREGETYSAAADGLLLDEPALSVRAIRLDHSIPCLAFTVQEKSHVNVWKNRVEEMGFRVGPWLRDLKAAILRGDDQKQLFRVRWTDGEQTFEREVPLGELRDKLTKIVPGQKISYVVDALYSPENEARIVDLARDSEILYIESPFLHRDAEIAAKRFHLTAHQAGTIARQAQAKRMVTFHFSPRYTGEEEDIRDEAQGAFAGESFDA